MVSISAYLRISLPRELAESLAAEGLAVLQPAVRAAGWQVAWDAASAASTVVTLAQSPEVIRKLAEHCWRLLKRDEPTRPEHRLDARGPGGQLWLRVTPDTDVAEVGRFLRKVIFPPGYVSDDEDR